ncbi:hypothetical protein FL857_11180 [Criibacterium bergeronii]|uniref:P/Homo B domain-containing protein n=1 Tax=Criibacterium bergeronii TaxID=1871336 RepID=A0A552UW58_9FIRM|nr:hypothetical protein [Criibacterium bergeronii]TRW22472.1 hypothetical protein FL857_11180 [Criibacterium bergeronii]
MKKIVSFTTSIILALTLALALPITGINIDKSNVAFAQTMTKTGYFSGMTGTMNSLNGQKSRIFFVSSPTLPSNAQTSTVELNVTVSSSSSPFYIYVIDPSGFRDFAKVSRSGKLILNNFSGHTPDGKWQIYIESDGFVSTGSARMKVNYTYQQ